MKRQHFFVFVFLFNIQISFHFHWTNLWTFGFRYTFSKIISVIACFAETSFYANQSAYANPAIAGRWTGCTTWLIFFIIFTIAKFRCWNDEILLNLPFFQWQFYPPAHVITNKFWIIIIQTTNRRNNFIINQLKVTDFD